LGQPVGVVDEVMRIPAFDAQLAFGHDMLGTGFDANKLLVVIHNQIEHAPGATIGAGCEDSFHIAPFRLAI
jgi:hypothetical protein